MDQSIKDDGVLVWYCTICENRGKKTLHDNGNQDCPYCGAHDRYQAIYYAEDDYNLTGYLPKTHPDVVEMYQQKVRRGIKSLLKDVPITVFKEAFEQLMAQIVINLMDHSEQVQQFKLLFDELTSIFEDYKKIIPLFDNEVVPPSTSSEPEEVKADSQVLKGEEPIY